MKLFISTIILFFVAHPCFAQDSLALPGENVQVVKQFEPNIGNAVMYDFFPKRLKKEEGPRMQFNYPIDKVDYKFEYPEPVIKPLVFEEKKDIEKNNGYVKAGYGNLNSPIVEAQMHYDIQEWFEAGINLRHHSAKEDRVIYDEKFADSYVDIYGGYFLNPNNKISAVGSMELQDRTQHRLIFNEETSVEKVDLNNFGFGIHFDHNTFENKGFSSKQNIEAAYVSTSLNEIKEWDIAYSSSTNKKISKNTLINLKLEGHYFNTLSDTSLVDYFFIATPELDLKFSKLRIKAGAHISNPDSIFIRPELNVFYDLPWYNLQAKASYTTEVSRNGVNQMLSGNAFYYRNMNEPVEFQKSQQINLGVQHSKTNSEVYLGLFYNFEQNAALYVGHLS